MKTRKRIFNLIACLSFMTSSLGALAQGNDCAGAAANPVTLPYNGTGLTNCGSGDTYTSTNVNACGSTAYLGGEDILFAFTAPSTGVVDIDVTSAGSWIGLTLYQGCPTTGACIGSSTGSSGNQSIVSANVTAGQTYYVMVDSWPAPSCNNFDLSISNVQAPPPPATNDDPCQAIPLTPGTACVYSSYSNLNASATTGVPAPGCASYSDNDVWFSVTVPASGLLSVDTEQGTITDAGMAAYSATSCNGPFTLIDCDDDGSANGAMSALNLTGLTPGSTVYLRVWDYSDGEGTFGICVTDPPPPPPCGTNPIAGNTCATATPICDLNGYCGSTAATYTDNSWTELDAGFSGSIENNSFISFVASGSTMSFNVWVSNCNSNSGIQMYVFSAANCTGAVTEYLDWNPGSAQNASLTVTGLTAGDTYYIMIDGNGGAVCDYTIGANSGVAIPVDAGPDVSICLGESTDLTAIGGDGTYSWTPTGTLNNNNSATVTATPTTTTTYTVSSATGNPLCPTSTTDDVTVTVNTGGDLTMTGNSAISGNVGPGANISLDICNGGSATLNAAGGTNYNWTPTTGLSCTNCANPTANPTTTTTYTVTADNASGCDLVGTVTVNVTPAPTVTVNSGTICEGESIVLTASGMTTYSWTPTGGLSATTGASVTANPTTTTAYTITGSTLGCPDDDATATVTVNPLPTPNFSITGNQCLATNSITLTNTGTAGTYAWNIPGGTPATGTGNSVTTSFGAAGTQNITLTTTTAAGCIDDITIPVTINPNPTVGVTPSDVSCNGVCDGAVTAVGAGSSGYSYDWGAAGNGAALNGQCAGTYNVTVTDINGCTGTGSGTINEPTVLAITASATDELCNGSNDGTVTANTATGGTAPYSYSWSGGLGINQNVTGVAGGNYTVTVTDASGCTADASVTVNTPTAIVVTASSTDANCGASDGTVNVTSTTGGSGNYVSTVWTDATNNVIANPGAVPAGSYTVTVTDDNNCTGTATIVVSSLAGPTVSINAQTNAACSMVDNGTASVNVTGGSGTPTYTWAPAPGGGQGTNSATGLVGGTTYTVTVDDAGCTDAVVINIGTDPDPTVNVVLDQNASCPGNCDGAATATMTGGTGPFTYNWSSTETTQQATGLCTGGSTVTVTDNLGCTANGNITVTAPTALTVGIVGTDPDCNGASTGSADVTANNGTAPYTYSWTHGPTSEDLNNVLASGTYTVTVTDDNGCTATDNVSLTDPAAISIDAINAVDALCNGACDGQVTSSASGGTGALTYEWFDGATSISNTANQTGLCAGTYDLVVTDASGCTETSNVTVSEPTLVSGVTTNVSSNCNQADGEVGVVASGGTVAAGYTYSWIDAANAVIGNTATVTGLVAGSYTVTITDDQGCTATETATITDLGGGSLTETHIDVLCNGAFDGSINSTMTGGSAPFTYSWAGPNGYTSTDADISLIEAGTYDLTVTDNVNCVSTISVIINEPTPVTVTPTGNDANCFGSSDGDATVTANGGSGPYTYEWFSDAGLNTSIGVGANLTGLAAGTYYVQATDANGCTENNSIVINEPTEVIVTTAGVDANCGQSDGSVSVANVTGGSGTYVTEVWEDATNTAVANINAVPSGAYTVTVTDDQGCIGTAVQAINDQTGPALSVVTIAPVSCNGLCDGTALVNAAGGTPTYTYTWTPAPGGGQGTNSAFGLCAGDYTVSVSDDNNCVDNIIVTVVEPTPISVAITGSNDVTINGAADGDATALASGGTPAYNYDWYNDCPPSTMLGQTTATASSLVAGVYSVIATDSKGCMDTTCVTINEPTTIQITEAIIDATCFGVCDGEISITAAGGVPGYTYNWFDAANNAIGQTSINATGLCAGDYYVIVTDANGATQTSATYTVAEPTAVVLVTSVTSNYNGADISCNGLCDGTADVTASGGTAPYTYQWDIAAGAQTTAVANTLCDGTYTVTVTDDQGCVETQTVTLVEPTVLANTPSQTDVSCNAACDGVATAAPSGGTPGYTYQWDDPALSTTAFASSLCAGAYNVTITDANGCTFNDSYTITEPIALVLGETTTGSNCNQNDGSATVTVVAGVGPYTYQWDAAAGSVTTATANNLFAGCYDATVTDANGCTETLNICVQDLGAPTVTILTQTDVSCNGGNDGFAQIQVTGGANPYTYDWTDCAGTTINQTTASATNLPAGCFTGTMTDNNGCIASVNVTINEPIALNASITSFDDVTCFGYCDGTATVTAGGGTAPYTYLWNDATAQTTATATGLCPGTYQVTVTDANNCTFDVPVTIGEPAEIILGVTNVDAFCGTATGSATVSITSGGVAGFTYNWVPTNQTTATAVNLAPGNYTVTVTDANGCFTDITATVGDILPGTANIATTTDVSCNAGNDGTATVSMSGTGTAPYTYQWYDAATNTMIGGQTSATATNLSAGDYYVEVTDVNSCLSTSNTITINEPTPVMVSSVVNDALCFGGCSGTADAVVSGGTQPYTYLWDDNLNQTTVTAFGLCAGNYNVTVTDANGCIEDHAIVIGEPTAIELDSTVTNANCNQADGQGCVNATGGSGGYTYLWPDNSTNSCNVGLLAGTYIVTVSDQNGCSTDIPVEIQDLGGPMAGITGFTTVSCNGLTDAQATVDMTAGNGTSFTVQWDANAANQTTPTASNLGAGTYGVTITDNLGCNASTNVTITEPDVLAYNISETDVSCFSFTDGSASITVIGGTAPYNYEWLDNTNNILGTNNTLLNLGSGIYTINISDANNCAASENFNIAQPQQVAGTTLASDVLCNGACDGSATAAMTTGMMPATFSWDAATGNQTGSQALNLCPGTYTVTITDNDGCIGTQDVTITEPTPLTTSINQNQDVSCFGLNDGFAQVNAQGGTLPYLFSWDNGAGSNALASNLTANTYTATVTDGNGCVSTSTVVIDEPSQLITSSQSTDLSCFESCDGTASVAPSGGVAPYVYQWDDANFSTTAGVTALCAGTYNVSISDDNGCVITEQVNIGQPNDLLISATIINSNCGQPNGEICGTVNGGTAPYVYQWNDPNTQTSACANGLFAGCYNLAITDANGCIKDSILCINDIAGPTVVNDNAVDVTCFGAANGSVAFVASGGTGALTNEIFDDLGNSLAVGVTNLGSLDGGCYSITTTDAAGCVATSVLCINEPSQLNSAVIQSSDALCFNACNGTAEAAANGGSAPYTFSWNGGLTPNQSDNSGLCLGNYTVTVTDNNNCVSTSNVFIDQPDELLISAVTNDVSCFGGSDGSIDVTVTGGTPFYLYAWTPSGNTLEDENNIIAGNYTLDVLDANGCDANASYTINEPTEIIPVFASFNQPTCELCNGIASVSATGGTGSYTYNWNSGSTPSSFSNLDLCPGNIEVTVTDVNGCSMSINQLMQNQSSPVVDSITFVAPSCNGLSNGSATVYASGIFDPNTFNYLWDASANSQVAQTAVALGQGNYCVTVTDPNGCVASSCVNVTEPSPLVGIPDGSTTICYGDSTQVWASGSGGTAPYVINWSGTNTTGFNGGGPISVDPTFDNTYCFTVTDANGCQSPAECIDIMVTPELVAALPADQFICDGDSFDIIGTYSGGNGDPYVYTWFEDVMPGPSVGATPDLTVSPTTVTSYIVELSDGCSTPAVDTIVIDINANPVAFITIPNPSACQPGTIDMIGNSDIGVLYEWDYECDGVVDFTTAGSDAQNLYNNVGTYDVCLTVYSAEGCSTSVSEVDAVEIFANPVADFTFTPESTTMTNPFITVLDDTPDLTGWSWDFDGDGVEDANTSTHTFEYSDPGTYTVDLMVTNANGCTDTTSVTFTVDPDQQIFVPNAFTPDGDGTNDFFFVKGIGLDVEEFDIYVFNRWGEIIWEGHNPNAFWDGTVDGKVVQQDVYVWKLFTRDLDNRSINLTGHVTLVK